MPGGSIPEGDSRFDILHELIKDSPPPHSLSVTLMNGKALMYLEPPVVGSEKEPELAYLLELAEKAHKSLNESG